MKYFIDNDDWLKVWYEEWKKRLQRVDNFDKKICEYHEDLKIPACRVNKSKFLKPKEISHINYFLKGRRKNAFYKVMGFSSENDVEQILEKIDNKFRLYYYIEQKDLESRFNHIEKEWIEPKFTRLVGKERQEPVAFRPVLEFSSDLKIKFIKVSCVFF